MSHAQIDGPVRQALLALADRLDPELAAEKSRFSRTHDAAAAGNAHAIASLPLAAASLLNIARRRFTAR